MVLLQFCLIAQPVLHPAPFIQFSTINPVLSCSPIHNNSYNVTVLKICTSPSAVKKSLWSIWVCITTLVEKHQEVRFFMLSHSFAFTNNFTGLKLNKEWRFCGNKQNSATNAQIGNFRSAELVLLKKSGRYKWKSECSYLVWMDGSAQHDLWKVNCLNLILKFGFHPLCTSRLQKVGGFPCQTVLLSFWRLQVSWSKPEPAGTSYL